MPKRKDLIGQQFDELTVIEMLYNYQNKHRTYCKCIGIDGNEYIIRQDALVSGVTHTIHGACSGGKQQDITNQRFGKLIAISSTEKRATNGNIIWKCVCDCGNETYVPISSLKRGHTTSCGCNKEEYLKSIRLDIVGQKFGELTVKEEYYSENNKRRMMKCLCSCGNECICSISDLMTQHTMSCGCINKSKGEIYIETVLCDNNIDYITQKRFDGCRNKRHLPFDFYLPNYNICIEYDGIQHYQSIEYWGGEQGLQIRKENDRIKTNYCIKNNIRLIRIPYTMNKDDIYKTIINLTSPATTTV